MQKTYFKYDELHNPITHSVEGSQDQVTPIKHEKKHEYEFRKDEPKIHSETDTTPGWEDKDIKEKKEKGEIKNRAPELV